MFVGGVAGFAIFWAIADRPQFVACPQCRPCPTDEERCPECGAQTGLLLVGTGLSLLKPKPAAALTYTQLTVTLDGQVLKTT